MKKVVKGVPMAVPGINADAVIEAIRARGDRPSNGQREPDGKTIGLVIEGGGMRGIRSAGGLLALEAMGLTGVFDDVYACSAGAVNACYFLAGQAAYGTTIYYQNINNRRFIHHLRFRKILDLDFLFDQVLVHQKPLLVSKVLNGPSRLFVSVTDVDTGSARLIHAQESNVPLLALIKASSAIPVVYNEPVLIDGRRCIDGGVSNPIPLSNAIAHGCTHILVLLTRPSSYRNPDAHWLERLVFGSTCGRKNEPLRQCHLQSDREANSMRDLAFGRTACRTPVSIATISPGLDDVPVHRMTTKTHLLRTAATQFAGRTFQAFGADYDQMTEVLQPFKMGGKPRRHGA
jgi:predicted patatin/cPLA2 family phospholipase